MTKLIAIIEMADQASQAERMLVIDNTSKSIAEFEDYADEYMGVYGYSLYFYTPPIDFDYEKDYDMFGSSQIYAWMREHDHLEVEV